METLEYMEKIDCYNQKIDYYVELLEENNATLYRLELENQELCKLDPYECQKNAGLTYDQIFEKSALKRELVAKNFKQMAACEQELLRLWRAFKAIHYAKNDS